MENISFITVEEGDDLLVSFAVGEYAEDSLILIRTPKYEALLPKEERGVSVGMGISDEIEPQILLTIVWGEGVVEISTTGQTYSVNIASVDKVEIDEAKRVLKKMNFDNCFELINV